MALDVYKDWLKIPEGPRPPGHYELLRLVQFEDDVEKIRAHYRKLNAHVKKYASGQYMVQSQALLNDLAKVMLCLTDPERKREYDESLGREFAETTDEFGRKPIEHVLRDQGHLANEQVKEVKTFADARGLTMRDAVVQMKIVDVKTAAMALAESLRLSFVDLAETDPDDSVLDRVPRDVVRRNSILPLFIDEEVLLVACVDDPGHEFEEEMQMRFGVAMRAVIAVPRSINQAISKHYPPGVRETVVEEPLADTQDKSSKRKLKAKAKKKAAAESKSAKPVKSKKESPELNPEERKQRRQLGYIMICWSFAVPYMMDIFWVKPMLASHPFFESWPVILTPFAFPLGILYVLKVYWK